MSERRCLFVVKCPPPERQQRSGRVICAKQRPRQLNVMRAKGGVQCALDTDDFGLLAYPGIDG